MRVVMTAAHAGWGSELIPVGGGGAVCERLCEAWRHREDVQVVVLGTGPRAPAGVEYHRLAAPAGDVPPTSLSELRYAALCRRFEQACTQFVLAERGEHVVLAHDISEGPAFSTLSARRVPVVVAVHVDVVEYFTRMYMRGWMAPERVVRFFARVRGWGAVPDVLRLVFDKQWDCVHQATRLIVPSPAMKGVLARCYPDLPADRCAVVPWGSPDHAPPAEEVAVQRQALRAAWNLRPGERVLLTLSRISPEKGQDRLLEAVRYAESSNAAGPGFRVVICGAPAFMQGNAFMRKLGRLSSRLRTPVVFAGHLEGARKRAALELASVVVAPSRHESYGLTTMEAFAAGAPVVAVDTHGARATVDESCGRVVSQGRRLVQRLWLQIETLLKDEPLRARLSEGARRRAEQQTFSQAAERLLTLCGAARDAAIHA